MKEREMHTLTRYRFVIRCTHVVHRVDFLAVKRSGYNRVPKYVDECEKERQTEPKLRPRDNLTYRGAGFERDKDEALRR